MIPPSSFDDSLNPQLSSPDLSNLPGAVNLPGQEISIVAGESCSADGMKNSRISKRGGLDWFWNMFKVPENDPGNSPKVCPASSSPAGDGQHLEPQTETGGDGPDGGNGGSGICGDYILICCPGELVEDSEALEYCWDCELISGFRGPYVLKICRSAEFASPL